MPIIQNTGSKRFALTLAGGCLLFLAPRQAYAEVLVSGPRPAVAACTGDQGEGRDLICGFQPYSSQSANRPAHAARPQKKSDTPRELSWRESLVQQLVIQLVVMAGIPQRWETDPLPQIQTQTQTQTQTHHHHHHHHQGPPPPGGPGPGVASTPEPASLVTALIGVGVGGWVAWRRGRGARNASGALHR